MKRFLALLLTLAMTLTITAYAESPTTAPDTILWLYCYV